MLRKLIFFSFKKLPRYYGNIAFIKISSKSFSSSENQCCNDPTHKHNQNHKVNFEEISLLTNENFNESEFVSVFHNLVRKPWSPRNEEDLNKVFTLIIDNLKKIMKPESMILILDKSSRLRADTNENQVKLLNRAEGVFLQNYVCKSDKGQKLKAAFLVCTLNRYNFKHSFYEKMIGKVINEFDQIDCEYILTFLEGLTYNKMIINKEVFKNFLTKALKKFGELSIREIKHYNKILQLLIYRFKLRPDSDERIFYNPIFINYSNNILNYLQKEKHPQNLIFSIIESIHNIEHYVELSQEINIKYLYNKLAKQVDEFFDKIELTSLKFSLPALLNYMGNFFNSRYINYVPKKLLNFIENNILNFKFDNLKNLAIYLNFIRAKVNNFSIPVQINEKIAELIPSEKNIIILHKILEIYSYNESTKSDLQIKIIKSIEEKSMSLCKRLNYPSNHFLTLFFHLSNLNQGSQDNWFFFYEYFTNKEKMTNLNENQLFNILIPTLSIKSKNEFKINSNIALNMTPVTNYFKNMYEKTNLIKANEKIWCVLEDVLISKIYQIYPFKIPSILMNLVYANISFLKFTKIFKNLTETILNNLHIYTEKQVAIIFYAYARVAGDIDFSDFFNKLTIHLENKILNKPENFGDFEVSNIFWALASTRTYIDSFIKLLDQRLYSRLDEMAINTMTEYLQCLAYFTMNEKFRVEKLNLAIIKKINYSINPSDLSHLFIWANSLLVLENYDLNVWKKILNYIFANKNSLKEESFQYYFLYLIYLNCNIYPMKEQLGPELKNIKNILLLNKSIIINHFTYVKKRKITESEQNVIDIIRNEEIQLFGNSNDNDKIILNVNSTSFMFLDNLNSLKEEKIAEEFFENYLIIPYAADYRNNKTIIEENGKIHYFYDTSIKEYRMNGLTTLKKRFLENVGMKYIEIPFNLRKDKENIMSLMRNEIIKKK